MLNLIANQLFQETAFAGMKLKNRIIRSATHEGLADVQGFPTADLTKLYVKLAQGGVGAIITGYVGVRQDGKAVANMRMFDDDRYIEAYREINLKLKEYGTPLIVQLAHGGGQTSSAVTGEEIVAPSSLKYPLGANLARELSKTEIKQIIGSFIKAIERAQLAGFDAVQLHAAHGYLLSEFLSPNANQRKDAWGGNLANRFRIIQEILLRARERVGQFPILMKFSAYDFDQNGMRIEEAIQIAVLFQQAGGDAIEVSCGGIQDGYSSIKVQANGAQINEMPLIKQRLFKLLFSPGIQQNIPIVNYNVTAATKIKSEVDIPVIVVGGIRKLEDIHNIINHNQADYVSLCRPLIIEPDLVNKFALGTQTKSCCINCGYCLIGVTSQPLRCYYGKLPD